MSDALFRLIGDGDRQSGGAIPLPDAFSTVVNELLDHGSADFRALNNLVSDALKYKEERIMAAAWRSWGSFTRDIITVLEEMNLVREDRFSRWELTHEFVPGTMFFLPGTKIGFVGRKEDERTRRAHNEIVYLKLKGDLQVLQENLMVALEQAPKVNVLVRTQIETAEKLLREAEQVLTRELGLDMAEPKVTRYKVHHPRKPHEEGKRLRKGMTAFFRDEFWVQHAQDGEWYSLTDVSEIFNMLHPDQPPINHSDLTGSMRKEGRDMVAAGKLESKWVVENGARKWKFRKKTSTLAGYADNATVVPVVTWEGLKGDPKA